MNRRSFLGSSVAAAAATIVGTNVLFKQTTAIAADWPGQAFRARTEARAIEALFGNATIMRDSARVRLEVPYVSDGEVVRVHVDTDLPAVDAIAVVTRHNEFPLNTVVLLKSCRGNFTSVIRVGASSPITAYVRSAGAVHAKTGFVKVTSGGYGMIF